MANIRRIATTALKYGGPQTERRSERERERIVYYIEEAGKIKADIILFQEEYGFVPLAPEADPAYTNFDASGIVNKQAVFEEHGKLAIKLDDPYIYRVCEAARRSKVNVVLPIIERGDNGVYNSLVPITADGDLLRPYRKMHLVENCDYGDGNQAQMLAGIPVGFAICFDVHFDDVFEQARASGAKLILWASMWMGGLWLRSLALRYGFYMVSATPDGCTFVDLDGTVITESFAMWPQTAGHNNMIFEDLNFDKEIFHCHANGQLNDILKCYGSKIHIRNHPQDSCCTIESLDPDLTIEEVKREFGLESWYDYIRRCIDVRGQEILKQEIRARERRHSHK